jgi:nicotinamide-nucleotide amidase
LAGRLIDVLSQHGRTIATAESLTGGMIGAAITSVPGASAVYRGGVISYATDLKSGLAGVPDTVLARHGAVSEQTAVAMARGVALRCGADWGIAVTGVAGPEEQEGNPAGTVYCAVSGPSGTAAAGADGAGTDVVYPSEEGGPCWVRGFEFDGDRGQVRAATVRGALDLARRLCT